ncbi:hypothetical protein N665_0252s0011 [Sinapis alba]|nr:hypothetical protein N665_0252s0011 [Sinapis alba]
MASSSDMRKYLHRLYEARKPPIQNRSMNHICFLSNIQMVEEAVGEDVSSELRESAIGVIITGLNCDPFDKHDVWNVDHQDFWLEMKVPTSDGPTSKELQALFPVCRNWSREKRVMIGLLCLLSIGIFGISSKNIILLHCAKRVMYTEAFQRYPWGRVGFSSLVESIKVLRCEGKKSYTLHSCVHALLIWIYEFVPGLGEIYGNRIEGDDVPLLSWRDLVRVRHMIMKPVEDIYPKWNNDKIYTDLDNMIKDILNGQLNEKFWDAMPTTKCEKRKYGVATSVVPNVAAYNVAILGLVESIKILKTKIEGINVSATIDVKVEVRVGVYDSDLQKKIEKLEEEINYLKRKADVNIASDVANSKAYEDDDATTCYDSLSFKKEELKNKEVKKTEKKAEIPLRRVNQEKAFEIPQLNDEPISTGSWENHLQWEKIVNCRAVLEALASTLEEPTRGRKPQLTKAQVWPYVGNSTVKLIITGEKVSKEPYDPLAKVEAEKLQKVLDFIEPGAGDKSAGFFLKLRILRDAWPTKNYGWLHDSKWDQNTSDLSEIYSKAFNGEHPADFVTGKKWAVDVDDLFLCHHVSGDHWVAIHIDLPKEVIHVYDIIRTHLSDKQMIEECRPFMRMIPAFTYRRHKKISQNENPGDCNVYSLKYIDCLAVGCNFDGLNDQIITPQRLKLAADIYEEVTETAE